MRDYVYELTKDICKCLRILETVKEKKVDTYTLYASEDYESYNYAIGGKVMPQEWISRMLTKEEFDLLKEYFK